MSDAGHTCSYYCHRPDCIAKQRNELRDRVAELEAHKPLSLSELAAKHFAWVHQMGWHNKTVLEALALIASEVGEAVNECRGDSPTEKLGEELADIILRTVDLAQWQGINIAYEVERKMEINEQRGTRGRRI